MEPSDQHIFEAVIRETVNVGDLANNAVDAYNLEEYMGVYRLLVSMRTKCALVSQMITHLLNADQPEVAGGGTGEGDSRG